MRALGFWILAITALVAGPALQHAGAEAGTVFRAGMLALAAAATIAVVVVARLVVAPSPRRSRRLWVAVVLMLVGRGATAVGPQPEPSRPRGPSLGVRTLVVERASHPGPRCRVRVRWSGASWWLSAPTSACPLAAGQRVRVPAATLKVLRDPALPGGVSPRSQARSVGATGSLVVDRLWLAGGRPSPYWRVVAKLRQRAWEHSRGDPAAGLVVAAALGVRSALPPADRTALRCAGVGHLIAVSGLHVAVVAWLLLSVAGWANGRATALSWSASGLAWLTLLAYVLLTGASPPAVRAGSMALGVAVARRIGRPHHGPVLLLGTATAMLVYRPTWCLDPGFQLSLCAMAALVGPSPGGMLAQTWRVSWAVLPLCILHFGQTGLWGLLANPLVVPVFTAWVLPLGLLGAPLMPWLGAAALRPAALGAQWVLDVSWMLAAWPVPPLLGVALVSGVLLVAAVAVRRSAAGQLRPAWRWLPPAPVALAVVVVCLWPARRVDAPAWRWMAAGSARDSALISRATERAATGCVHAFGLRPVHWRGLLDAMGMSAVSAARPPVAPHEHAVMDALRRADRLVTRAECGQPPEPAVVRTLLVACRRRSGASSVLVVGTPTEAYCFVRGRFERLSVSSGKTLGHLLRSPTPERLA